MASDNLAFPLHDAHAAALVLRALIAAPLTDPAVLARAIRHLTPKELRSLEHVIDQLAHVCTMATADPWAPIPPPARKRKGADS